jgi:hypothetical protein
MATIRKRKTAALFAKKKKVQSKRAYDTGPTPEDNKEIKPSLGFELLRSLRHLLKSHSEDGVLLTANAVTELVGSGDFCDTLFNLIGDGTTKYMDKDELLESINSTKFGEAKLDELKTGFSQFVTAFSGGYDVFTQEAFKKMWQNEALSIQLIEAFENGQTDQIKVSRIMRFLIILFSPNWLSWKEWMHLETNWQGLDSLKSPTIQKFKAILGPGSVV